MSTPRSGIQVDLSAGRYRASIASVGATVRMLQHDGVDLIVPFAADELRPAMCGALLAPWPNRIGDGEYAFAGEVHRLVQNEPETGTAAHGLVAWSDFAVVEADADRAMLSAVVAPQPGYPWRLRIDVDFRLGIDGLAQEVTATNESESPAPLGLGGHPYLTAGAEGERVIDDLTVELKADRVLLVTEKRMLPDRLIAVEDAGGLDFRRPRRLGDTVVNNAFTGLTRHDGRARARLTDDEGRGAEIEWDERCPWVQVYTADHGVGVDRRVGLAVEPMTCPPDAFRSGRDLLVVPPGGSVSAGWVIRSVGR
ncbi:aldose 1-epimerase family protein [Microbacterium hydrocarbonoxydans]|uniref:aldose 1-epimerase family protein n=1 Tax=Microbacterium hydrocarbonoxydans TaxID=273678 RepID=UPI00203F3BAF|nr:aldose 1-epimerase family protein [Microbacterium hydrocarbonoxydans]MCM3781317.1 aldose 1-epimerase family protein [Microbacterium hydrocarbonoxydans]